MSEWKKLEALLFASGKYLTEDQLIALSGIPKNKIKKALSELTEIYKDRDTSLAVYNEADAWKLNVKEDYTDVIREVVSDAEMPRSVMETLAIIAYKSPVLQSEIKDIRGTAVYDHIPILEAKGFINREKHGRSYKLKLTNKFHEYFDIEGDTKLAELFKDVKKPDTPEKVGTLEVYTESEDDKFDNEILERMKKLEKTDEDHKNENNFLNEFEEKFEKTRKSIDESEQEVDSFKTNLEDSSSNSNNETANDESVKDKSEDDEIKKEYDEVKSNNKIFSDDVDDSNNKNMTSEENTTENEGKQEDEYQENNEELDEKKQENLSVKSEELFDENGEPVSDFVDKINHQIDDLTKNNEYVNKTLNSEKESSDEKVMNNTSKNVSSNADEIDETKDVDEDNTSDKLNN